MITIRELRQLGKQSGIKYASRMNSTTLCEKLGLPLVRNKIFDTCNKDKITTRVKIIFENKETHEIQEFPSIYRAAKFINLNPSCISHYVKKEKEIKIGEKNFLVKLA